MRPMRQRRETAPSPPGGFSLRPLPFRIVRAAQRHVESGSRHADRTSPEAGSLDDAGMCGVAWDSELLKAAARASPSCKQQGASGGSRSAPALPFTSDRDPATSRVDKDSARGRDHTAADLVQRAASTPHVDLTARFAFVLGGREGHFGENSVLSWGQLMYAHRSVRPPATSQTDHVRVRPSTCAVGFTAAAVRS